MPNPGRRVLSIRSALDDAEKKPYLGLTAADGFEWGVGRQGRYDPHAHTVFHDVLFAPSGMRIVADGTQVEDCRLFVAAPGCFFDPVYLGDFWFMKFVDDPATVRGELPDKVSAPLAGAFAGVRFLAIMSGLVSVSLSAWNREFAGTVTFDVRLEEDWILRVRMTNGRSFDVRR